MIESNIIIDKTRQDKTRQDKTRQDKNSALRIAVIGSPAGVTHVASCIDSSKNYVCKLTIIEGWFGKNFWKCFFHLNAIGKLRLLLHAAKAYQVIRKYRKILRKIPKRYFNAKLAETNSLELIPNQEFSNIDIFIIACDDGLSSLIEYKTSDYVNMLLRSGVSKDKIFCVSPAVFYAELPIIEGDKLSPLCKNIQQIKPVLRYMEYHVTDFCNLKCKGCSHMSDYVSKLDFATVESFRLSLEKLKEKFENVAIIRILGGEPLLCKNLHEYINLAHDIFPYAQLDIVTNGLLFRNITQETIDAIRRTAAEVQVSQYPPTRKIANELVAFLQENGLKFSISAPVREFARIELSSKNVSFKKCWLLCGNDYCHFLHQTTLYPCTFLWTYSAPQFKDIVKEHSIDENECKKYTYDLTQNIDDDGWDILMKIESPIELCNKCGDIKTFFKWESRSK